MGVDEPVVTFLAGHRVGVLDSLARGAMAVGTSVVVLLLCAVVGLVLVLLTKQWRLALAVAIAFLSSVVVTLVMKGWIDRARPPA
jgi:predicted RND superfamily exporter protein